jgi:hypothetical protein
MVIACGGGGNGSREAALKKDDVQARTESVFKEVNGLAKAQTTQNRGKDINSESAPREVNQEETSPPLEELHLPSIKLNPIKPSLKEDKVEPAPKPSNEEKAPQPHPTIRLIPIKSYPIEDAWRKGDSLKGQHVRLTGEAEVKRSIHGVYAVFTNYRGRRIAVVAVKNEDAEPLQEVKIDESEVMRVNLETTVKGIKDGWYLALEDSEFLPLDAPEGFVSMDELPIENERAPAAKHEGIHHRSANPSAINPAVVGNVPSVNMPTTITRPSHVYTRPSHVYIGTGGKPVHVSGYYKKDGTYVRSHSRAAPGMGTHHRR